MEFAEKTLNSTQIYDGKVVKVFKDDVEIAGGRKSFREVVKHSGGVVVLAVKNDEGKKVRGLEGKLFNDSNISGILQKQQTDKNLSTFQPFNHSTNNSTPTLTLPLGEGSATVVLNPSENSLPSYPLTIQPFNHSTNNSTPTLTLPPGEGSATVALNPSENSLPSYPLTFQPTILFVRQYRYPIAKPLLELPAGKLEYGEDPFLAAKRELEEETGYCANKWTDLGYVYTSPGYSDEKLHLYMAEDLEYTHCHPDEGEILEPLELSYEDALKKIKTGEISDAKTLCAFMRAGLL